MSKRPSISVIIPVYNGARYLGQTLETVFGQTVKPDEIVIADDGSTDNTETVAKDFGSRIKYLKLEHEGCGPARNAAIDASSGELLALLDADDVWMPNKLELQLEAMYANTGCELFFSLTKQFISPELDDSVKQSLRCTDEVHRGLIPSALLIRREDFFRVGYFSAQWTIGEFADWYARSQEASLATFVIPQVLVQRRLHGTNMGIRDKEYKADYLHILKAALDRRKKLVNEK